MKFDVILADPPWNFKVWNEKTGSQKSPKYKIMSLEDIKDLPVADVAKDNCALFLWVTWPFIFEAKPVIEGWGFRYSTLAFDWFKTTKKGKAHFGMGYTFRANPEPCLLAFRGKMPPAVRNERNWMGEVMSARYRGHSVKPDEQYEKIERVYPAEKYPNRLEMFARRPRDGWTSLGNGIDGKDIRQSLIDMKSL